MGWVTFPRSLSWAEPAGAVGQWEATTQSQEIREGANTWVENYIHTPSKWACCLQQGKNNLLLIPLKLWERKFPNHFYGAKGGNWKLIIHYLL